MALAAFPRSLPSVLAQYVLPDLHKKLYDVFQSGERDVYVHIPNNFLAWELYSRIVLLALVFRKDSDFHNFSKRIFVIGYFKNEHHQQEELVKLATAFGHTGELFEQRSGYHSHHNHEWHFFNGTSVQFCFDGQIVTPTPKASFLVLDTRLFSDYPNSDTYECLPIAPGQYCCIVSPALHCSNAPQLLRTDGICRQAKIPSLELCPHYPEDIQPRVDTGQGIGKYISRSISRGHEYNRCIQDHERRMYEMTYPKKSFF